MSFQRTAWLRRAAVLVVAMSLGACTSIDVKSPHLNIDADGYAADDRGRAFQKPADPDGTTEEQREVAKVIAEVSAEVAARCESNGRRAHVMLFVHGGMVGTRAALKSSREIEQSGVLAERDIIPIFINWNSSLFSALADDLFWVRAGNRAPEGIVVAPVVVATRLVSGIFEAPPNLFYQLVDETRYLQPWTGEEVSAGQIVRDGAIGFVHAPFTIVSVPLFTGFGRGAWSMMKRRIDLMYAAQKAPQRFYRQTDEKPGAMRTFLVALAEARNRWEQDCAEFELDFFGHSMGALVGTRLLREFGDIELDRIIFAAAASTAEDFVTTLPAYLKNHPRSRFYNYGLSVVDEGNELTLKSAAFPRGSLLVWVDNFFDPLLSPEDYRVGDYFNKPVFKLPIDAQKISRDPLVDADEQEMSLMRDSLEKSICPRLTFVKFAGRPSDRHHLPRKHGDFNDPEYLRELLNLTYGGRQAIAECGGCASYDVCTAQYLPTG